MNCEMRTIAFVAVLWLLKIILGHTVGTKTIMATLCSFDQDSEHLVNLLYHLEDALKECDKLSLDGNPEKAFLFENLKRAREISASMLRKTSNFPLTSEPDVVTEDNSTEQRSIYLLN